MAEKPKYFVSAIIGTLIAGVLALPISNYFLKRQPIEVTGGVPEFKAVSQILQNKCADCHSPGMLVEPVYGNFPFAKQLIADDVAAAQKEIVFSRENLSGEEPFTRQQAAKILNVVENNEMPIAPYRLLHWNAILTEEDTNSVTHWLEAQFQTGEKSRQSQQSADQMPGGIQGFDPNNTPGHNHSH